LSNTYESLSKILLSRLTPYTEVITENIQRGFRLNSSTTNHIFCLLQIQEKKGNTMRRFISFL